MKPDWLAALKKSPVSKLNEHLFAEPRKMRKPRKDCTQVVYITEALQSWAEKNGQILEQEFKFHPLRKYRFDFAFPSLLIAIEYEGGLFMKRSGHNSPTGIQRDIEKYHLAQSMGWKVIRMHVKNYQTVISELEKFNE